MDTVGPGLPNLRKTLGSALPKIPSDGLTKVRFTDVAAPTPILGFDVVGP
jgi:hypothetical protein